MNIVPLTPINSLIVCHNVPLDNTYKDTITFGSVAAQAQYFASKAKYTFNNMGPTRMQNAIAVPKKADDLYDCNYIAFANDNFSSKWFYAFITAIDYVNTNVSMVHFELDVMQTWYFNYTIKPSFVEREHTNTDGIGDSLTLEPVDIGEYITGMRWRSGWMEDYVAVLATAYNSDGGGGNEEEASVRASSGVGGLFGGMFSGLDYFSCGINSLPEVGAMLDYLQRIAADNKVDSIAASFVMPEAFFTTEPEPVEKTTNMPKNLEALGTYVPKNKKLFTYPYNFLTVTNGNGESHSYRYELFDSPRCSFSLKSGMSCNPEILLVPKDYDHQTEAIEEGMVLSGFPQFAYVTDTYKAWLAQNANSLAVSTMFSGINMAIQSSLGNIPAAMSQGAALMGQAAQVADMSLRPNSPRGSQGTNTLVATRLQDFWFYRRYVREDYAKIIDDFFDMYGYACGEVKIPNITGRPYWNYVKTKKISITGSIPFDDIATIRNIYDTGITFWHGDYVGAYNLNNSPGGGT